LRDLASEHLRETEGGVDPPWIRVQNVGAVSGAVFVAFADTESNLCEIIRLVKRLVDFWTFLEIFVTY
jgi:hypothetical protein